MKTSLPNKFTFLRSRGLGLQLTNLSRGTIQLNRDISKTTLDKYEYDDLKIILDVSNYGPGDHKTLKLKIKEL